MCKFSGGSGGFDPSFSKTEQIRMMGDNKIRQGSRMQWVKDRTDIKSADSEVGRPWIKFNVTGKEKKGKKKMTAKARGARTSEQKESS